MIGWTCNRCLHSYSFDEAKPERCPRCRHRPDPKAVAAMLRLRDLIRADLESARRKYPIESPKREELPVQEFTSDPGIPVSDLEQTICARFAAAEGERGLADDARAFARYAARHWPQVVQLVRDLEGLVAPGPAGAADPRGETPP